MSKKLLLFLVNLSLALVLSVSLLVVGCGAAEEEEEAVVEEEEVVVEKESIVIGAARPLSGPLAFFETNAFGPIYKMWVEEVNARGGIYVEEYGKKLLVEMKVYDDTSDMGTMTTLLEKLILEDEVDFVFPPASTAFLFAAGAVANRHGYILLGAEGGATTMTDSLYGMPYFFGVLNYSDRYQLPVMADLFEGWGVETVAIIYAEDLHGIEYAGVSTKVLGEKGIEIAMIESVPFGIKDVSALLLKAKALDVDAFLAFCYPDEVFLTLGTAIAMDINFDAMLFGPGGNFEFLKDIFGVEALEGVMGYGAWNEETSTAAADFADRFIARWGRGALVWWGHLFYQAALEFFEQAIVEAGTLDQEVIRDIMATSTFDTVLGPTWFDQFGDGGCLLAIECHPGEVGQWQDGIYEVVDPGENRTADPIYPKPDWPAPAE